MPSSWLRVQDEYRNTFSRMFKILLPITCIFISKTLGIGSDYYYEDTEIKHQNLPNISLPNSNTSNLLNNTGINVADESVKDDSLEDDDLSFTTIDIQTNVIDVDVVKGKKEFHSPQKSDYRKLFKSILPDANEFPNIRPSVDIFKEYEYNSETESNVAHHEEFKTTKQNRRTNPTNFTNARKKKRKHKSKKTRLHLIDYYTIEPAAAYVNPKGRNFYTDDPNIWYVPEDLPCWQLPLLYGEFEFAEKPETSDIFSIHRTNLKNIVHEPVKHRTFPKAAHDLEGQLFNKWCEIEPCYGDHTLCLFPDKTISSFCEKQYSIVIPTTTQQIELVNTLNSMRNRVAMAASLRYKHLPTAANMQQVTYDSDLEKMSYAWLSQCLPGPAPCSALDGSFVTMLECKKYVRQCCGKPSNRNLNCTPPPECFVSPIIGCLHNWYWSAGLSLTVTDVQCGHIAAATYSTAQLFWANTHKIGCASGISRNGDIRVVCNFAPGAPFYFKRKFYCGLLPFKDITQNLDESVDVTNLTYLSSLGINLEVIQEPISKYKLKLSKNKVQYGEEFMKPQPHWGVEALSKIYSEGWVASHLDDTVNGTKGMMARIVTQYTFYEESQARCDTEEPIYAHGQPASMCLESGRRYPALCYHFGDPTPGFRLVAILAPVTLFSLVLYDLFSSAVKQTI